jgi:hypothetical protein
VASDRDGRIVTALRMKTPFRARAGVGRMVSYPSSRMPAIAARFIDEIERLEKEWNLT